MLFNKKFSVIRAPLAVEVKESQKYVTFKKSNCTWKFAKTLLKYHGKMVEFCHCGNVGTLIMLLRCQMDSRISHICDQRKFTCNILINDKSSQAHTRWKIRTRKHGTLDFKIRRSQSLSSLVSARTAMWLSPVVLPESEFDWDLQNYLRIMSWIMMSCHHKNGRHIEPVFADSSIL